MFREGIGTTVQLHLGPLSSFSLSPGGYTQLYIVAVPEQQHFKKERNKVIKEEVVTKVNEHPVQSSHIPFFQFFFTSVHHHHHHQRGDYAIDIIHSFSAVGRLSIRQKNHAQKS